MIPFILGALAAVGLSELSKRNKPKMADGGSVDSEFVKDKSRLLEILEMKGMSTLEHEPEITAIKNKYKGYRQDYDIKDPRTKAGMDMLGFLRDKNLYAKGGGVDGIQISVNAQRYLEMLEEMYPKFLNIDTTTPSKDINKAISELEEKGLIKRLSYSRGFAEYGLKDKKYATGGGVGRIDLFDKDELINLIKSYDFKSVDVSNMETISYSKSENPFNIFDVGTIKLSPLVRDYNDSLLIVIDKYKGKYIIRIGADTGWTGGLELSSVELTFDIPKLTFEEFKKGFLNATINQNYCLVSKYGTGNIDTIHFQGNLQEIKDYALENGYELKESNGIFDFYFYKKDFPSWRNDRLLQVYVLSSQQIDNITERNEGSRYATGGALSDVGKMIKEQVKDTKDLSEKYSSKEKRKDLLKFKKSALKEYGKDIGGLYVKNIKRKAKFLADHPEILVGKVF